MKNVMSWKTTSSSGVRLGSAFSSWVKLPTMRAPIQSLRRPKGPPASIEDSDRGGLLGGFGRLALAGGVPEGVDRAVRHLVGFHGDRGDPIAEEREEEDCGDRQRDPLQGDVQGH